MDDGLSMLHVGMVVYYFLMVIVIVNILTALVSVALQNSADNEKRSRHLTFLFNRLGYVTSWALIRSTSKVDRAKMSFEHETYYAASKREVVEFYRNYIKKMKDIKDVDDKNDMKDMEDFKDFLTDRGIEDPDLNLEEKLAAMLRMHKGPAP
ncbi:hypothetical protein BGZ76_004397 [Entomortierella beljakovae]|nr:hypothetical protein BGZ76_004397 [Entomortierella beljakovae]